MARPCDVAPRHGEFALGSPLLRRAEIGCRDAVSAKSPGWMLAIAMDIEAQKRAAAARALEFVRPGMRLGLGTGSTARHFVELLGERVRAGLDVIAVPTSEATRSDAERLGIAADHASTRRRSSI